MHQSELINKICKRPPRCGHTIRMRWSLRLCLVVFTLWVVGAAHAQAAFDEDSGSHRILGPKSATGAIIWSHGRSLTQEDSLAPTPNYVESFRMQGWDAFRFNRGREQDSLLGGSHALARFAAKLKTQGYRIVVLAGQSYGAFMSLMAADFSNDIDAVIAVAPAAFGPVRDNPTRGALNASRLYPLLERARHARVMLFYFSDDIYDPGGRGPRSEEILRARQQPHLVVDRPWGLETHWAGSTKEFSARFGSCIVAFAHYGDAAAPACLSVARSPPPASHTRTRLSAPASNSHSSGAVSSGSAAR